MRIIYIYVYIYIYIYTYTYIYIDELFKYDYMLIYIDQQVYHRDHRASMTAIAQHSSAPLSVEVHLPSWRRGANGEVLGYRQLAEQLVEHVKARAPWRVADLNREPCGIFLLSEPW